MATRVLAVANQKGGVGKTTTVINLSACLAELGKTVLVIDLDPQANATSGLGLPRQHDTSLYRVLLRERSLEGLIQETVVEGVHIIPSELDLAGAEIDVARMEGYLHCLNMAMAPLLRSASYDFIIIDCPPSLGILTMNALTAAQGLLLPIQCEYYALEGLSVITHIMQQLREGRANPDIEIEGIVMTMYDARTRLAADVVSEVRSHFGERVYNTVIPRNVRLSEAPSFGKPVIMYDSNCTGSTAYRELAKEVVERTERPLVVAEAEEPAETEQ
ncbi:MAG: ParA family protein [Verrucomicrobia bacterium]|jgi:chromosome partitioning protein|nr:ParA family protein [Verrucomicrobiota bacterium]